MAVTATETRRADDQKYSEPQSPIVYLADARQSAGSLIENTTIDCNHVAGSIGVFGDCVQELGGFRNVSIANYKAIGIAVLDQFNLSPGTGFAREGYIQVGSPAERMGYESSHCFWSNRTI
jgi:hypothetical protein